MLKAGAQALWNDGYRWRYDRDGRSRPARAIALPDKYQANRCSCDGCLHACEKLRFDPARESTERSLRDSVPGFREAGGPPRVC